MLTWTGGALALFFILCACGLFLSAATRGRYAMRVLVVFSTACSLLMMFAAAAALATGRSFEVTLWHLDGLGPLTVRLDMLSAIFLFTAGLVDLSASVFVRNFVETRFGGRYPLRRYGVLHFALMASVVLILTANDAPLFLISWECMSILCYLLVNYERGQQTDARAGYDHAGDERGWFPGSRPRIFNRGKGRVRLVLLGLGTGRRSPFRRSCLGHLPAWISWFRRKGRVGAGELLAASLLYRDASDFHSRAGRHHVESRVLRNLAIECGPGIKPRVWYRVCSP